MPEGADGAFWLRGRVIDGDGEPVPDAVVETWQADPDGRYSHPDDPRAAARLPRLRPRADGQDGAFAIHTVKPGPVPGAGGATQAPHLAVSVFARGLLNRVVTRVYFADEADRNAADPVLAGCPRTGAPPCSPSPRTTATASTCGCRERMRPSSSPSEPAASGGGLFGGVLARGRVAGEVSDAAWLRAMLDVEAALARAQARAGLLSAADADAIAAAAADRPLRRRRDRGRGGDSGNPVVPLVKALTDARSKARPRATSTPARRARTSSTPPRCSSPTARSGRSLEDLDAAADAAAALAEEHAATSWPGGRCCSRRCRHVRAEGGDLADRARRGRGAAGRGAAHPPRRPVRRRGGDARRDGRGRSRGPRHLADELGLAEPVLPWHTIRTRPAELAGALGAAAGVIAKAGRDVVLLAQTEVGEVREGVPGRGGSSTLPHKQNPVAAISAVAARDARARPRRDAARRDGPRARARRRGVARRVAAALELLETVGSAAAWLRDCLEHLEVDAARMRANLDLTHGALLAERVTTALAADLGRHPAHELVEAAAREAFASGRPLADVLAGTDEVAARLDADAIGRLLDPAGYLGATDELIRRALRAHRAHRERGAAAL